ncbi:MAG: hypothetical protein WDA71_04460 [Actinomycetota bacterium]
MRNGIRHAAAFRALIAALSVTALVALGATTPTPARLDARSVSAASASLAAPAAPAGGGNQTASTSGGNSAGSGATTNPPARADVVEPTATNPTLVETRAGYGLTFETDLAGTYAVDQRLAQDGKWSPVHDKAASGTASPGRTSITLPAPKQPGTYDLRLRFLTDERLQSQDEEPGSLIVCPPTGSRPAQVAITGPTADQPAILTQGAPSSLSFTTDTPGRYEIAYRSTSPVATGAWSDFPDGKGIVTTAGSRTAALTAPGDPGTYDLRLTFTTPAGKVSDAAQASALIVTLSGATDSQRCDPIDPTHCLLPFPSNVFTAADPGTTTGRRVNLNVLSTPRNAAGKPIDPTEWNRNDGFSPGAMLLTFVSGLDLHQTWGTTSLPERYRDQVSNLALSLEPDAPMVILNTRTGERHPFWSELDSHAGTAADKRLLIIRPAVNFEEGTRYVVALRNLSRADGSTIGAGEAFANYRDVGAANLLDPDFEARRPAMERIFSDLAATGMKRQSLCLAWDFTVASERNLSERMLHIRDDAFAGLGDTNLADVKVAGSSPAFTVDTVTDFTQAENRATARRIEGTVTVPNYLTPQASIELGVPQPIPDPIGETLPVALPGSRLNYLGSTDGLPVQSQAQPDLQVPYVCDIPHGAASTPARPTLYGHGLLGDMGEATGSSTEDMRLRGFAMCATNWIGMALEDLANVGVILADLSNFGSLADRGQQGFLNFLFLGRALIHPQGLVIDPAFRTPEGKPLIDTSRLFYDGNSQGGIMGGALTALSVDFTTAVLGVTGMNYSTLLQRSTDWEGAYGMVLYATYPDSTEQMLAFDLIQMLWDRAEANGYAHHMTDRPYPNTPKHQVMMQLAFSDHQVSNFAAEVEARTIGARMHSPMVPADMHWSRDPMFDLWPASYSKPGYSYAVYWFAADRGNLTPPTGNIPSESGGDPHGDPRKDNHGSDQKAHFLLTGELIDVCAGGPCVTTDATRSNG